MNEPMHYSDKLDLYFETANKFFPELRYASAGGLYGGEGVPGSANVTFSGQQEALRNSPFYQADTNSFIHYTSVNALFEMLNSASFRIYSLNNSNDRLELKYGLKRLGVLDEYEKLIDYYSRGIFLGSFCDFSDEKENFEMWRLYGHHGHGVAINFEIQNLDKNWISSFFGKVQYGESAALEALKDFTTFHNSFQAEQKLFLHPNKFLPLLSMLHKNEMWKNENEYRLFSVYLTDNYSIKHSSISWDIEPYSLKKLLNKTVNSTGKEVNFINLPLNLSELEKNSIVKGVPNAIEMFGTENPSIFHHYPHLKIKQIILGYQIDPKVAYKIGDQVESISEGKIGYQPKLKFSDFSADFKV